MTSFLHSCRKYKIYTRNFKTYPNLAFIHQFIY